MFEFIETFKFIYTKESLIYLGSILFVFFILSFTDNLKDEKNIELIEIQKISNILNNLKKDRYKLEFAISHLFKGENLNYEIFLKKAAKENRCETLSFNDIEISNIGGSIKKRIISISGLFWHDRYIFNFINEIKKFHPGFIFIDSLSISKISEISFSKPVLNVELICEILQK